MEDKHGGKRWIHFLSTIYITAAIWLLGVVCHICYPSVGQPIRTWMAGLEDSPVREAFSVLAEGLEKGSSVADAVSASVEVLMGEKT